MDKNIIDKCKILLTYCFENNIEVKDETIKIISEYDPNKSHEIASEKERVWKAYRDLNSAIGDINVENILQINFFQRKSDSLYYKLFGSFFKLQQGTIIKVQSHAKDIVKRIQIIGFLVLLLTIFVRGYSNLGASILANVERSWNAYSNLDVTDSVYYKGNTKESIQLNRIRLELSSSMYGLVNWNKRWITFTQPLTNIGSKVIDNIPKLISNKSNREIGNFESKLVKYDKDKFDDIEKAYFDLSSLTNLALIPIQTFILPFFYALLGTIAYVTRDLTYKIKNKTYNIRSNLSMGMRIFIGSLAGLTIGMFVSDKGATPLSIQNLSSDALAFLAGYNIELLFNTMDKIIQGITGKQLLDDDLFKK